MPEQNKKQKTPAAQAVFGGAPLTRSANSGYYNDILLCCVPLTVMSCYYYGLRPALLMLTALFTAYVCDCVVAPLHGEGYRPHENSSECFAALIALMMPATISYPILAVAVVTSVVAKETFGGEGHYPFHPAAVGLVVAAISWPDSMFRYPTPGTELPLWDCSSVTLTAGMNAAIKAGALPTATTVNLLIGNVTGSMGACSVLVMAACGVYLLARRRLRLSVFIPYIAMCVAVPWLFPRLSALPALSLPWEYVLQRIYLQKYMLLSGTSLFGGIFLACEPVTQPNRTASRVVYGLALGVATVVFRYFSEYETGVCFALIIVGAIPEWLDHISRRAERMKYMRKEEQRSAKLRKAEQ